MTGVRAGRAWTIGTWCARATRCRRGGAGRGVEGRPRRHRPHGARAAAPRDGLRARAGSPVSALVYNGHDLSAYVTAELVEPAGHALEPRALAVPGRPGAVLAGLGAAAARPRREAVPGRGGLRSPRRSAARSGTGCTAGSSRPGGGELAISGEPGLAWRDAVVTGVTAWDSLFEDGSCEVEFTCFDPVAYGAERASAGTALAVGGTWATWPTVTLAAAAGPSVRVADELGRYVLVERAFSAGDEVVMDFAAETVTVGGADASADVAVESTFFIACPRRPHARLLGMLRPHGGVAGAVALDGADAVPVRPLRRAAGDPARRGAR